MSKQAYNLQSGDGLSRVFKIVPFVNGDLPTAPPVCRFLVVLCPAAFRCQHNLPALHSERDVDALLDQEVTDYLIGYQALVADLPVADRKRQILLEIGGFGI
jgi:hypothetical protein